MSDDEFDEFDDEFDEDFDDEFDDEDFSELDEEGTAGDEKKNEEPAEEDDEIPEEAVSEEAAEESEAVAEEGSEEVEAAAEEAPAVEEDDTPEQEAYSPPVSDAPPAELLSPKDIPLKVSVELARLEMSAADLMDLKPGNVLELSVRPEDGVDLVVAGRRVGHAEIARVGKVLGMRITEVKK